MSNLEDGILNLVDDLFKLTDEQHKEVIIAYKGSLNNIRQLIAELYVKYAVEGKLNLSDLYKYNRLVAIEDRIKVEIKNLGGFELKQINLILKDIYKQSFYKTAYFLESGMQVGINFALLKPEFVKEVASFNWSGVPFSDRIWDNANSLVKALRTELTQGIIEGDSIDKMARRIKKRFDTSAYNSQRLIRTESARVISSAQEKIYNDSGVVKYVEYVATLDNRTSETCRNRDGKRWKVDDPTKPKIPAHPNCRSTWIPVISDDYKPKKRKDNETKEIIEYKNYDDWYKAKVKK
ncbi:minor capsid protein [Schinkia azotoformans]|uniref:minor capsid protein n=1 Tax=Schinkia azotoformans TaxID=1454 RepID=UPI002DB7C179|nr:minor capsid protein [Schinkia azotoformans]MEC1725860.1 minor capsid protein [Schinkia azotoformans]